MSQDIPEDYDVLTENKVRVPGGGQCAACLMRMDGASAISTTEKIQPKPGDMAVCCFCGAILTYEEKLVTHVANEDEMSQLTPEQRKALEAHSDMFKEVAKYRRENPGTKAILFKLPIK